ncbi:hypothetical protein OIDMADRAFT_153522 [Oidiodendron maius Zn]|uniref:Cytochrome P450 n=1 Tax=Oidiodendron maius (strain Zn) TaxID=913774 RepID=A0A0C3I1E2_OIDMZ|nr:hypothetical protein OIDMADRAFT_153522 [Oidiodendron maius Zn]
MCSAELSPTSILLLSAVTAGFLIQQFANLDIDKYPFPILGTVFSIQWIIALGLQYSGGIYHTFWAAQSIALLTVTVGLISLWANTLIYRAFFHPLNRFPGPYGAKLSKLWVLNKVVQSDLKLYQVADKLQKTYGDYVRTAVTDYGPSIEEFTSKLVERLDRTAGGATLVNEFCTHYAYDVMSSLAFGTSTRFIEGESNGKANIILKTIQKGIVHIAFLAHLPWALSMAETLWFLGGPLKSLREWSGDQVEARRHFESPRPDIIGHLLANTKDDKKGRILLHAEGRLIVGAGSDTTGSALAVLLTFMAYFHDYQEKLHDEVEKTFADKTYVCTQPQTLLDSIINEALRLCPPILFNSQRMAPKGGLRIGDIEIPEGTVCLLGPFTPHHDERNFLQANEFIPERWTSRPELIINKIAFIPFSMGPYMCPGKAVAMMEMRSVIAHLVQRYRIDFPKGANFDIQKYYSDIVDHFTAGIPDQELVFTPRNV